MGAVAVAAGMLGDEMYSREDISSYATAGMYATSVVTSVVLGLRISLAERVTHKLESQ